MTNLSPTLQGLQDAIGLSVVHSTWQKTKPGKDNHAGQAYSPVRPAPAVTALRIQRHGTVHCVDMLHSCATWPLRSITMRPTPLLHCTAAKGCHAALRPTTTCALSLQLGL